MIWDAHLVAFLQWIHRIPIFFPHLEELSNPTGEDFTWNITKYIFLNFFKKSTSIFRTAHHLYLLLDFWSISGPYLGQCKNVLKSS